MDLQRLEATPFGRGVAQWLRRQQDDICAALSAEDGHPFGTDAWEREAGGGGVSRVLEGGGVFEKGGVLFSAITGARIPEVVRRDNPELPADAGFFATGVSLILHPHNPYVPTVHYNVRYFEVGEGVYWYGGGMDLTPYYPFREDCVHFHRTVKDACDRFDPGCYDPFKAHCDRYFYLPHRGEHRGIGGIFFNYLRDGRERTGEFIVALGPAFLEAYLPIVRCRRDTDFGQRERDFQCYRRGRYVEFNLLYDQGTLFGLQSGGRTESILVSMPPRVHWHYNWQPGPGTPEARLTGEFLVPRDWARSPE